MGSSSSTPSFSGRGFNFRRICVAARKVASAAVVAWSGKSGSDAIGSAAGTRYVDACGSPSDGSTAASGTSR